MRKLLYVEDEFLNPSLCHPFINLHGDNKEETFLEAVTHSDSNESLTYGSDIPELDGDYGAIYLGGDVTPLDIELSNELISEMNKQCNAVVNNINTIKTTTAWTWAHCHPQERDGLRQYILSTIQPPKDFTEEKTKD